MNERIIAVTLSQTGNCTTADWVLEFPFPTQLLGIKHCVSNADKNSTIAVAGGATLAAATFGLGGDPTYTQPDSTPDYAAADTVYTVTFTQGDTPGDDPLAILFFLVGEGGSNFVGLGENLICVCLHQTGDATDGAWVVEFPFPTQLLGLKASGSNANDTTITVAGGAAVAAAAIGDSGDPEWITPDSTPDYADPDTAYTFTITQGSTRGDDPCILAFFAVGEGGANFKGLADRVIVTTLMQTGDATTAAWVKEFPFPVQYLGSKASGSNSNATTLTVAGGAVAAAAQIGDSGDPNWLEPTTAPDYVAKDTICTLTITQSGTRADDPMVLAVWSVGEG